MSKIYVIVASGGSYDDAWESNLFAVTSETEAIDAVNELTARHEKLEAIYQPIYNFFRQHMRDNAGLFAHEEMPDRPKGASRMTKEGQAAYKVACEKWVQECRPIARRNQDRSIEQNNHSAAATRIFAFSLGATEEDMQPLGLAGQEQNWPNFDADTNYSYEELELR